MGKLAGKPFLDVHPVVFWTSTTIIFALVITSAVATGSVASFFEWIQSGIVEQFGWFYVLSMTFFLGFAVWLMLSRFGNIKLGPDHSKPQFSLPTWFAMLFSAGMGIGLLFFSVAEPIKHYASPPSGDGQTLAAAGDAMGLTFFHWGLHPWAVYCIVGLSLAYFGYRRKLPFSIRSALYPLVGERIHGRIGDVVDILAVVSTLFGVATSLGLGAMQVNAGLEHVFGIPRTTLIQAIIIAVITAMATLSVVSGLEVGVRRLSELNMGLAGLLLLFLLIAGPTAFLLSSFVENLGSYIQRLPVHSYWTGNFTQASQREWLGSWTVFYWAWWIAWAPFVGMFIARISRGRTVREFVVAVLIVPTLMGFFWLTVFGDTALYQQVYQNVDLAAVVNDADNMPTAIFVVLEQYPLASVTAIVCTCCVVLFFVTSSDSASLVVDTIASGGKSNPPVVQRIFWAVLEGVVAGVLLYAGGLRALQTAAITTALPFCVVIVVMCVGIYRALRADYDSPDETAPQDPADEASPE